MGGETYLAAFRAVTWHAKGLGVRFQRVQRVIGGWGLTWGRSACFRAVTWRSKGLGVGFQWLQEVIGGWGTHLGAYCMLSSGER